MRLISVTAVDFGPLTRQTLGFAPGLTVVIGGNESGKSSWHAASYAALCGRRRGRGRPGAADQRFIDAHRPWSGGPWQTRARLQLDDGREIELTQELAGLVACRAVDLGLARDVSAEVMSDGSPDAAVWCGLSRETFRATACVDQGALAAVVQASDGLQAALQQAVSRSAPWDGGSVQGGSTAAAALSALEACRRESVGRDASTSVRPLRHALDAVDEAERRLEAARGQAAELEELAGRRAAAAAELDRCTVPAAADSGPHEQTVVPSDRPAAQRRPVTTGSPQAWSVLLGAAVLLALLGVVASGGVRAGLLAAAAAAALAAAAVVSQRRRPPAPIPPVSVGDRDRPPRPAQWHADREAALQRRHEAQLRLVAAEAELAARSRADAAAGGLSLAAAEEQLAVARTELARVRLLDETLGLTIHFLSRAQEQVHREVAPELSTLVSARLPAVTAGRYSAARIDPASLAVEVRDAGGTFRPVSALSHGTREQLHLLLRVALVELLTAGHDTCPLLLDDVTVHADPDRTDALLELLLQLAQERQVVLFAHQDQVRAWASARLDGVRHALVELDAPEPGACVSVSIRESRQLTRS